MSRTKGTYTLTSNIEPKVGAPLDARTIVKLLADLTASNTFEYPYKGMKVFVEENNKSYTLVGSDPTVSTNWVEDNSGGHTIKNSTGTAMTQRSNLQFVDLTVSDDSINDVTKVENIHVIQSESELDNLPDGLYMLDDDEGTVIDGNLVGYDNTDSELDAENVQDAIDEVVDALDDKVNISAKGVANGVAELDSTGKVPSSQLPSFVDDVIEVTDYDHLPATGETGKIYVALDTNKIYRWGGTEYVEISESLALGETSSTAYRGDRGKAAYDHSQLTSGNPHNVTKSDIGLGNVDNTSDSTKKTNFTGSIASGNTGFVTGGDAYTALSAKADKVTSATNGNLAGLDGNGNPTDSGWNGAKGTTSISGNPISISGLKANQLAKNPIITLEPIQAGSGTPSPSNIRAISGYDKIEVLSCGKNLFDGTYSATGVFLRADGSEYAGTYNISQYISVKANAAYYFSNLSGTTSACICWYNKAKEFISSQSITEGFTATSPVNACYVRASIRNDKTNVCINEGNTAITYEPCNKTTDLSESFGQTVYGGSLDVRTGVFTVTHGVVDLGTKDWSYHASTSSTDTNRFSIGVSAQYLSDAKVPAATDIANGKCDIYQPSSNNQNVNGGNTRTGYISVTTNGNVVITDTRFISTSDFKTAVNGIKFSYELKDENKFTIQLTPHEISLLKDYAYVSTNGTSIALDYHNGELASLGDVSQLGETVNELGEYVETITDNNYVDCSTCSTIYSIFETIMQGQSKLKSTAYGVGNIGALQNTNLKTLLGNPGLTNYVHAYIRPIVSGTNFMKLAEVYAVSTVNTQSAIKRKYIWISQSSASQSAWETINYMT